MSKLWKHDASNQAVLLFNHKLLSIFQLLKRFFCDGLYVCSIRWSQYYHQLRYFFTFWKWKGLGNILCTSPQSKPTENALKLYLVSPTTLNPTCWRCHNIHWWTAPTEPSRPDIPAKVRETWTKIGPNCLTAEHYLAEPCLNLCARSQDIMK